MVHGLTSMVFNHHALKHSKNRLKVWRDFRQTLTADETDQQHLQRVAAFWAACPLDAYYIDWDKPEGWPGPWEILTDGHVCPTGMAILLAHTLFLIPDMRWSPDRVRVQMVRDQRAGFYPIVVVDGRAVLNYEHGEVVTLDDLDSGVTLLESYSYAEGCYVAT